MSDMRRKWQRQWGEHKTKLSRKSMGFAMKVFLECLVLAGCLFVIGFLMQDKMTKLLNSTMEQFVAGRTADLSLLAEERFQRELSELHYAARYLGTHPDAMKDIVDEIEKGTQGTTSGLLTLRHGAVAGKAVDKQDFPELSKAFHGNDVIDYCVGKGLMFAVPVYHGDNVRYVLYRMYDDKELTDVFGLQDYDADSHILIWEKGGQLVVPYANYGEKDREFFADSTVNEGFERVREKLSRHRAAAVYSEGPQGRFFLFGADLPRTDCSMIGYVPWEAVAGDVSRVYVLVLLVVSLLLLLFAIASVYLFMVQARVAESDALRKAKKMADRASEAKSRFLAQMSHEIRTPINAVLGMNEMILRESTEEHVRTYAQKIGSSGQALLALINDILDFSKIESGHMELTETRYHLDSLLNDIVNIIEPRTQKKGLEFHVHVASDIPNVLWGDAARVRQVMVNVLSNAVKYTRLGSVEFEVSHRKRGAQEIALEIKVKDTGIGIREEDQKRLFHDFERLDAVKNRDIEGTGLGLVITYKLLKMMMGDIRLESVYGEGSTFSLMIPQSVISFEPIGDFTERMEIRNTQAVVCTTKFVAPEAKVLLVDDNEVNLFVAESLLKETKMQIYVCLSGEECLAWMVKEHFDIILLDYMMPELDGVETLKKAKELETNLCRDTPVIALTANAVAGARDMFLAAGFADYLAKPISGRMLEETLLQYLPEEKLQNPEEKTIEAAETAPPQKTAEEVPDASGHIDTDLGLSYNGGMEELYAEVLRMFVQVKEEKREKMCSAWKSGDWKNYTTLVHALKSTSLTIGCSGLSEQAKALELAGKKYLSEAATQTEKDESIAYIREHHDAVMRLYDAVTEEAEHLSEEKKSQK